MSFFEVFRGRKLVVKKEKLTENAVFSVSFHGRDSDTEFFSKSSKINGLEVVGKFIYINLYR